MSLKKKTKKEKKFLFLFDGFPEYSVFDKKSV
jgi:hypothetical protein